MVDWVFDLDNTLYPPSVALFDQIEQRMTAWVQRVLDVPKEQANHLRKHYWAKYGTTLAGLMREHDVDPGPYLHEVHDINFEALPPAPDLADALARLPGRRFVYTNGTAPYARNVLAARGLDGLFDGVFGVEHAEFHPKPEHRAFARVFETAGIRPSQAAMFEDDPRNLEVPHKLGMRTVHVAQDKQSAAHIHHHTSDLTAFLQRVLDGAGTFPTKTTE